MNTLNMTVLICNHLGHFSLGISNIFGIKISILRPTKLNFICKECIPYRDAICEILK